jgi:hypothetical protein
LPRRETPICHSAIDWREVSQRGQRGIIYLLMTEQ